MRSDLKQGRPGAHAFEIGVLATCRRRGLVGPGDRVLIALSGGPDSTSLLAALQALHASGDVGPLVACHVDHQLRAGSAEDGRFCEELCARLAVPLRRVTVEVGAGNLQAAARRVRYAALREVAGEVAAHRIATGHTRSDQAETVLWRLVRGAGARGLAGIPARRGRLVRPLLDRSRPEVLAYLAARGLPSRDDPTNASPRFDRSRIRHEVLPLLESLRPGAEGALARAADLLRADERALEARARALVPPGAPSALARDLLRARAAVRGRAVRRLWRAATGSRRGLEAHHVEAIARLLTRGRPGRVSLPGGRVAAVAAGVLKIEARPR